jgi:hypothetical protein
MSSRGSAAALSGGGDRCPNGGAAARAEPVLTPREPLQVLDCYDQQASAAVVPD